MTGELEFFEVLVVSQGFEYRISNFTMDDFRRDRLPNFKEPDKYPTERIIELRNIDPDLTADGAIPAGSLEKMEN